MDHSKLDQSDCPWDDESVHSSVRPSSAPLQQPQSSPSETRRVHETAKTPEWPMEVNLNRVPSTCEGSQRLEGKWHALATTGEVVHAPSKTAENKPPICVCAHERHSAPSRQVPHPTTVLPNPPHSTRCVAPRHLDVGRFSNGSPPTYFCLFSRVVIRGR